MNFLLKLNYPNIKKEVIDAMEEIKRISKDPNAKSYSSLEELNKTLNEVD